MKIVLIIALVVVVFPYIAGPLLLWMNGSRIAPTNLEEADSEATLTANAESHFWKTTYFFASNGFEKLGNRVRESSRSQLAGYKQVWRHGETGEVALVGAFVKTDDPEYGNAFVAFMHERANGAMVATTNFDAGARTLFTPPGASKLTVKTQDIAALRELHMAHVRMFGDGERLYRVRDGFTLCKQLDNTTRAIALSKKHFRAEGDSLRITLWGAVAAIWINLPPLKGRYERRDRDLLDRVMAAQATSGERSSRARAA